MPAETYAEYVSIAVSLFAVTVALSVWRRAAISYTREDVFAIRADLFDAALKNGQCFDDPAYREMTHRLNGFLRFIHTTTGWWVLYAIVVSRFDHRAVRNHVSGVDESQLKDDVKNAQRRLRRLIVRHYWMVGVDGLVLMLSTGLIGRFRRMMRGIVLSNSDHWDINDEGPCSNNDHWTHRSPRLAT